jgi:internalin A
VRGSRLSKVALQPLAEVSDAELLGRYVRRRDEGAFAQLVARYSRLVWAQCRNLLPAGVDADDAFQATFLTLARSAGKLQANMPFGPWLHGVAYRVCQNARRAIARRTRRERACARPESTRPVADSAWEAAFAAVAEEVQGLPAGQRAAFVLCCIEGRSTAEAAAILGVKPGALAARLSRAKQTLLDRLTQRGIGAGILALGLLTNGGTAAAELVSRTLSIVVAGVTVPRSIQSLTHGAIGMAITRFKLLAAAVLAAAGFGLYAAEWYGAATAQPPGTLQPASKTAPSNGYANAKRTTGLPAPPVAAEPKYKPIDRETIAAYEKLGATYITLKVDQYGNVIYRAVDGLPGFTFERLPDEKLPPVSVPFYLGCKATDGQLKALNNLVNLTHLELHSTQVTDAGLKELKGLNNLRWLSLMGSKGVSDEGLQELRELKNLDSLDLGYTAVTDVGMKELSELKNLTRLSLYNTKVTDVGLKELRELKNLKSLLLINLGVTDAGLKELKGLAKLSMLDLYATKVTDAGMIELRELKDLSFLELSETKVGDAGLRELKDLKGLNYLGLVGTKVTNGGMKDLKSLESLTLLSLGDTALGDAGLNEIKDLKNLTYLGLQGTKVTDEGVKELKGLKNLTHLILYHVTVSKAAVKELQEALPKCSIQTQAPSGRG